MLNILFQHDYLAAVDKPPGLLVHRSGLDAGEKAFAVQLLRDQIGQAVWPPSEGLIDHPLRRHMKHIAHPILGDSTHGKGPLNRALALFLGVQRMWLHASALALKHPVSGQALGEEWAVWQSDPRRPAPHDSPGQPVC